jgi:UDP-N-acetyl-D-mannosaminuronic acid dehydrogenase
MWTQWTQWTHRQTVMARNSREMEQRLDVAVIGGFGHVGLPLGLMLADSGLRVGLYDIDQSKRTVIESGAMPFLEHDSEPVLKRVIGTTLHIVDSLEAAARAETVVVTIGTPIDEHLNPKMLPILALAEQLSDYLHPGSHVLLRSTVFPGTTKRFHEFLAARVPGVRVSFCPERIVQGHAIHELRTFPQIISGCDGTALERAKALFERLGASTIEVSVQEAELSKLFTNAWRYLQFAIANQFYMMAAEQGADFDKIYHAMTHDYPRANSFPTPGFAAGPCLLKDTLQLVAFHRNAFPMGQAAMWINEGLPAFIVDSLRRDGVSLESARVGILGMAFKADTDDIRDSLSFKLAKILRFHGATVVCSDAYVDDPAYVAADELVRTCSIVIVGAPHSAYRTLHVPQGTQVIDLWGVLQDGNGG